MSHNQPQLTSRDLSPAQLAAIDALASGTTTYTAAARIAGVDRRTLWVWRRDARFAAALDAAVAEVAAEARLRLRRASVVAVDLLERTIRNRAAPIETRVRAALAVLDRSGHGAKVDVDHGGKVDVQHGAEGLAEAFAAALRDAPDEVVALLAAAGREEA